MRKVSQPHLHKCGLECWNALEGGGGSCGAAKRVEGGDAGKRAGNKVGGVGVGENVSHPSGCSPAVRLCGHGTQIFLWAKSSQI